MARVVVVGSVNMDLVARARSIPRVGETVSADRFSTIPGGKGANQAVAAARLGASCALIGRVGDDTFAPALRENLESEGVDTRSLLTTPGCSSGVALIMVDAQGQNLICVVPGANHHLTPADIEAHADRIREADALLVQFEVPQTTVAAALRIARQAGVRTLVDPAPACADPSAGRADRRRVDPQRARSRPAQRDRRDRP